MDESSLFIAHRYPVIPAPILKDSIELPFQLCWEPIDIDIWSICDLCSIHLSAYHPFTSLNCTYLITVALY